MRTHIGCAHWDRRDVLHLSGRHVELRDFAAPGAVDQVRIEGIGRHVAVLDGPRRVPVAIGDAAVVAAAQYADRTAFLLSGADAVREGRSDTGVVELCGGLVEPAAPGFTAIYGNDRALIADEGDDAWVSGADPQVLIVIAAGCAAQRPPALAPVRRLHGDDAGAVHHIGIGRVHAQNRQVAAADAQRGPGVGGDARPALAAIVGAKHSEPGRR